ncbi:MAG TPA: TIGR03905 family TSCPD domain-containing protein [Clostridiales bacterium]|mgnify:FL=1|nr:TIGR03905 family TSCPD domain-containing protein [Clostridiales bacterium]
MLRYLTTGVCSREILFSIQDNKIQNIKFYGGCSGNLQGICKLVEGMDIEEVIKKLSGIRCGYKNTSCPDQLARALASLPKETTE